MAHNRRIRDGYVGYYELIGLLTIVLGTKGFLTTPRTAMIIHLTAGWIFGTITVVMTLISFYFIAKLFRIFPGLALDEIYIKVFGPWLGFPLILITISFYTLFLIINLREFAELIIGTILPNTPISNIMGLFMIAVLYGTYLGVETFSRAAWLQAPFFLFAFIVIVLFSIPNFELNNLFPLLGRSIIRETGESAISMSRVAEGILCLGALVPFIREKEKISKIGYYSISLGGTIILACLLIFQLTFGVQSGLKNGIFPVYQVVRLISLGSFFQRIEVIFLFMWILSAILTITTVFYCLNLTIARQLRLPSYRPLLFPIGLIIYTLSFLPTDFLSTTSFEVVAIRRYGSIAGVFIPLLVFVVAKLKGLKGGGTQENGNM